MANHHNFGMVGVGRAPRSARAVVAKPRRRARSDAPYLAPSKLNAPMLLLFAIVTGKIAACRRRQTGGHSRHAGRNGGGKNSVEGAAQVMGCRATCVPVKIYGEAEANWPSASGAAQPVAASPPVRQSFAPFLPASSFLENMPDTFSLAGTGA